MKDIIFMGCAVQIVVLGNPDRDLSSIEKDDIAKILA